MKKHEEIVWRLKEQPTTESLRELVKDKILTNDEARQILFSSRTVEDNKRDRESLENEIKFLRELVEKLSQNRSKIIEVIKEVKVPYYNWTWYKPYEYWCGSNYTVTNDANGSTVSSSNSSNLVSFSSIQTF